MTREALSNAARHAHATRIRLSMHGRRGRTCASSIEDDGVGFDATAAPPAGHLGLANLRQRAAALGGDHDHRQFARARHPAGASAIPIEPRGASRMTESATATRPAPAGRRRPRGRPPGARRPARPARGLPGRRRGRHGRRVDRAGPPAPARHRDHGRPPAGRLRHRGVPRDPGRVPGDPGRDAHLVPGRGGRPERHRRGRQRLPAQADPGARPGRRARDGRARRVAARSGRDGEGPRADPADRVAARRRPTSCRS